MRGEIRALQRRLQRDVQERGRTPQSVQRQFADTVAPMANRYIRPTKAHADLVLSGETPIETLHRTALEHIKKNRRGSC